MKWIEESCTSGVAWRGVAWRGVAWRGVEWSGVVEWSGEERRGVENPALGESSEEWIGEFCTSGVE